MESFCANKTEFRSIVESLIFLANTRLNIQYVISLVERFMSDPSIMYLKEAKRILRYIRGKQILAFITHVQRS